MILTDGLTLQLLKKGRLKNLGFGRIQTHAS